MYLTPTTNRAILQAIAASGAGTTLVVNFLLEREDMDELGRAVNTTATEVAATDGEPVRARYRESEILSLLQSSNFANVELLNAEDLANRYVERDSGLRLPRSTIIAIARA